MSADHWRRNRAQRGGELIGTAGDADTTTPRQLLTAIADVLMRHRDALQLLLHDRTSRDAAPHLAERLDDALAAIRTRLHPDNPVLAAAALGVRLRPTELASLTDDDLHAQRAPLIDAALAITHVDGNDPNATATS